MKDIPDLNLTAMIKPKTQEEYKALLTEFEAELDRLLELMNKLFPRNFD